RVTAVDLHRPFLDQLERIAEEQGLSNLVEARLGDMGSLDVLPGSVDLIWSEGAAYILGFEEALCRWRPLLKPRGLMVLTERTWLTDAPPEGVGGFGRGGSRGRGTVAENRRRAEAQDFQILDTFVLPASAWWDDFYTPLLERVRQLRGGP